MHRRPLREAAFSVLKAADIPSVLVELGFLSSPRDLKNIEFHILDTGHFALEEDGDKIAHMITCFLAKHTEFLANHPEYREMCELAA